MEPEQMSDTIQSPHTVVVTQKPAQTFDPKDVVEAAKGVVSGDGKGFMPLTDFPPTKPYEDWQYFLEKQRDELNQERERLLADDPKTFFEEQAKKLEAEKNRLEQRCESDLKAHLSDLKQRYEERLTDQAKYHGDGISRREDEIYKLETKIQVLETETKSLVAQIIANTERRLEENTQHYEARINDMRSYNAELRDIFQSANQEAWAFSKESCKYIQECVQARESKCRVSDFLGGKKIEEDWKVLNIIFLIIVVLVLTLFLSLSLHFY